ncbi:hypothetical protein M8J77_016684 [Diaphorina citri]|nr:hypothetical protein M8J77_016684 [Diaphorina citri]
MEGDSTSPICFITFINDIEEYLRRNGMDGVSINSSINLLLLLYCDDLIILASSRIDMQRKLDLLASYCNENQMTVNEAKSKIVVFRRGGKLPRSDVFFYNNRSLEVCCEYVYLGVKFSSHGVFHKASQQAVSKGRMAVSSVRSILVNSKMESQESRMKLYKSIVMATLLYGAEVWGSRYEEAIEACQSQFLKSVFCLPRNTPHYMIRLEMGVVKLSCQVVKQMLEWWIKLLSMSPERYPRICYNQLMILDQNSSNVVKYNWVSQLKQKLVRLGFGEVWESQSLTVAKEKKQEIPTQ